jgi:hypothetical protein
MIYEFTLIKKGLILQADSEYFTVYLPLQKPPRANGAAYSDYLM